jgi:hypothetical protein
VFERLVRFLNSLFACLYDCVNFCSLRCWAGWFCWWVFNCVNELMFTGTVNCAGNYLVWFLILWFFLLYVLLFTCY